MPIEFNCQSCSKLLRVPDTAAGKQARCPDCQQVVTVPASTSPVAPVKPSVADLFPTDPNQGQSAFGANPYSAPRVDTSRGPSKLTGSGSGRLEASKAVGTAWTLFKEHIGLLVGCFVVLMVTSSGMNFAQQVIQGILLGGPVQPDDVLKPELIALSLVFFVLNTAIQSLLVIGLIRIQLCIARGQETSFEMLFSGGRWFLKVFLANILFAIITGLGFVALIIPGFYLLMRYWTYSHFIVDKDCGIMESFSLAGEASKGNMGETFLLALIGLGLGILGILMLCIGILFTTPVIYLAGTIAYLMMTGQSYRQTP